MGGGGAKKKTELEAITYPTTRPPHHVSGAEWEGGSWEKCGGDCRRRMTLTDVVNNGELMPSRRNCVPQANDGGDLDDGGGWMSLMGADEGDGDHAGLVKIGRVLTGTPGCAGAPRSTGRPVQHARVNSVGPGRDTFFRTLLASLEIPGNSETALTVKTDARRQNEIMWTILELTHLRFRCHVRDTGKQMSKRWNNSLNLPVRFVMRLTNARCLDKHENDVDPAAVRDLIETYSHFEHGDREVLPCTSHVEKASFVRRGKVGRAKTRRLHWRIVSLKDNAEVQTGRSSSVTRPPKGGADRRGAKGHGGTKALDKNFCVEKAHDSGEGFLSLQKSSAKCQKTLDFFARKMHRREEEAEN